MHVNIKTNTYTTRINTYLYNTPFSWMWDLHKPMWITPNLWQTKGSFLNTTIGIRFPSFERPITITQTLGMCLTHRLLILETYTYTWSVHMKTTEDKIHVTYNKAPEPYLAWELFNTRPWRNNNKMKNYNTTETIWWSKD